MTMISNNIASEREDAKYQVLLEIMQGLSASSDLHDFIKFVHLSIAKVIYAENFFIIVYNKNTNSFEEVYSVDEFDSPSPPSKLEKSISAYVFRTGEPLLLTQARFDQLAEQGEVELVGTNSPSWLGIPLKKANETIGVMGVQDYEIPNRYAEKDKDFLAHIAGQVAIAIERKQVEAALKYSMEEYKHSQALLFALNNVIQAVQRARTSQAVYHEIAIGMSGLSYRAWLLEFTEDRTSLHLAHTNASSNMVAALEKFTGLSVRNYQIPLVPGSVLYEAIQTGETTTVAISDQEIAKLLPVVLRPLAAEIVKMLDTNYMICAPLVSNNMSYGILVVIGPTLSPLDAPAITAFAAQASIALENARLYEDVQHELAERRTMEAALRESEERFKLMAWATKDAVWDWDLQTNQVWWGEGLQKIFHYSSERTQTNAEWWFERIHPEDLAKVKHAIDQALEMGMEFWSKEYRFQRKDGSYADIIDRGYIMRDEEGKPYRMVGAMLDITERKYMESSLRQANQQMSQFLNELQRHNTDIVLLNEMGRLLQACQSSEEAYRVIGELSSQLFPGTTGAIYLFNSSRTLVSAVTSWGQFLSSEQVLDPNHCWALYTGKTHPLREDGVMPACHHLPDPLPAVSYCLPMQIHGEILGFLHVRSAKEENVDEAKHQLAYTVVEQAGMALSNLNLRAALREQSIRDPLTALYNRRYMEEILRQHLSRVTRSLHPLAIIMIDIDHFKGFNDQYGHTVGDLLLGQLGRFLQNNIRREDVACRYGGEEFILIMPDATLEQAQHRADYLRQEVKRLQVHDFDQSYSGITLSLGVAAYPQHGRNIDSVLRMADGALYRAKQQGRDRVVVAEKKN